MGSPRNVRVTLPGSSDNIAASSQRRIASVARSARSKGTSSPSGRWIGRAPDSIVASNPIGMR